jgi:hypothetical protein
MRFPTEIHKLEEITRLLRQAWQLSADLIGNRDDLQSLLSVTESEAKRLYAEAVTAQTEPGTIPVILSDEPADKPKGSS